MFCGFDEADQFVTEECFVGEERGGDRVERVAVLVESLAGSGGLGVEDVLGFLVDEPGGLVGVVAVWMRSSPRNTWACAPQARCPRRSDMPHSLTIFRASSVSVDEVVMGAGRRDTEHELFGGRVRRAALRACRRGRAVDASTAR